MMKRFVLVYLLFCGFAFGQVEDTAKISGAKLWLDSKVVDLGLIPIGQAEIEGAIAYMNDGDDVLRVSNINGSCDCFAGFSGDMSLDPGIGGELLVKFDKAKIESGPVKRLVHFETNDPDNKQVRVTFSFEIERTDSEEIRFIRKELTTVKRELSLLRSDMRKVLAALSNPKAAAKPTAKRTAKKPDTTIYDVKIGTSPILGKADAPITIVEFIDFQCPFCVREYPKLKEILTAYPDKVRVVFKHMPLTFHKKAKPAHAAAQLALEQGGSELFWKMYDKLMANPSKIDITDLREYAKSLKMDLAKFDKVMEDPIEIDKLLEPDLAEAKRCNVSATPTIMINGLKLTDRGTESYKTRIDQLIKPTNKTQQAAK